MELRIHTVGASGSGTTTLASELAQRFAIPQFDADEYYWEPTDPPFTVKRPAEQRVALLAHDLNSEPSWVLSGSLVNWGDSIKDHFTHVIFITLPPEIRIARLRERERKKFGSRLDPGGDMHRQHLDFIEWAKRYDKGGLEVRSKQLHEAWLSTLKCPVLRVSGELDLEKQAQLILQAVR